MSDKQMDENVIVEVGDTLHICVDFKVSGIDKSSNSVISLSGHIDDKKITFTQHSTFHIENHTPVFNADRWVVVQQDGMRYLGRIVHKHTVNMVSSFWVNCFLKYADEIEKISLNLIVQEEDLVAPTANDLYQARGRSTLIYRSPIITRKECIELAEGLPKSAVARKSAYHRTDDDFDEDEEE